MMRRTPAQRGAGLVAQLGLFLVLATAGCEIAPEPSPAPAAPVESTGEFTRQQVEAGRAIYNFRCYYCHGYPGDAKTLAATFVDPAPRDFQAATPDTLPFARILQAVHDGRPGTAMKPFAEVIDAEAQKSVAAFVFDEFVRRKARNTRYHTPENGWPGHEKYRAAFPFALGEVALTVPPETLSLELQRGRRLFVETCISCHDRGKLVAEPVTWEARPLSFPRHNYDHRKPEVDAATSATPYRLHDVPPVLKTPTADRRRGEHLFQNNCAFCHAADGTGKNWIGSFLEPRARDLTDPAFRARMTPDRYREVIREGLPGTTMPAWKDVLSRQEIDDLIAYLDVAFGGR